MAEPVFRKPAGGIEAVALTPAGNLLRAAAAADGELEVALRDEGLLIEMPLLEERSTYTERTDTQAGPPRVRHTLTLALSREEAQRLFDPAFRRTATTEGFIAIVTAASGERLLAGWSARMGSEQPLRLDALQNESGAKPIDGTAVLLTLTSEDADPAVEIKTQQR